MSRPIPEQCIGDLNDEIIKEKFSTRNGCINSNMIRRCFNGREPNARQYIENRFKDSKSFIESVQRIFYGVEIRPVCKICGNEVIWRGKAFADTCCQSCAQKFSTKNTWRSKEGQAKCEASRKKYFLAKYGVTNPGQISEVKEKVRQTCLERYGVDNVWKAKEIKDNIKEFLNSDEYRIKRYNTHKKNHSFNISKIEDKTYDILLSKFPDCIHHYRDKRYPYSCDFYIPSLDLFIELHYHWTHGGHPYNEETDKEQLEKWKLKGGKYYENAIKVWTLLDVKKLNIFLKNNLNFKIFYNSQEFMEWFEKI